MKRFMLKSKIHRATVTDANLDYEGSLTISPELMEAADILPYERVFIYNITNGHRFDTYAIEGERGSSTICVNGAAARLALAGDLIIVTSFVLLDAEEIRDFRARVVHVDRQNHIIDVLQEPIVRAADPHSP